MLELHSNKTDRRQVLNQLGRSWDRAGDTDAAKWVKVTDDLSVARDQLNAYVKALHLRGSQGFSIFEAIGWVASRPEGLKLGFDGKDCHDKMSFDRLIGIAGDLGKKYEVVIEKPRLPLISHSDWSFAWQEELLSSASLLKKNAHKTLDALRSASSSLGLREELSGDVSRRELLSDIALYIAHKEVDISKVPQLGLKELRSHVESLVETVGKIETQNGVMAAQYSAFDLNLIPLKEMDLDWRTANTKIWPASSLACRKVSKLLQSYTVSGVAEPSTDLPALLLLKDLHNVLDGNPLASLLENSLDHSSVQTVVERAILFRALRANAQLQIEDPARFDAVIGEMDQLHHTDAKTNLSNFQKNHAELARASLFFGRISGNAGETFSLAELIEHLDLLEQNKSVISDWTRWTEAQDNARNNGLSELITSMSEREIQGDIGEEFRLAYARWWLPLALDAEPTLRRFADWEQDQLVNTFRKLDDEAAKYSVAETIRLLQHELPAKDGVAKNSELGILRHQLGLQRPSMPIRKLLGEMPTVFPRLAPCVLMSPLSIAQYFPAGQAAFDIVIFDEASQITTWDAVGAIARGKQTIIVGDPKQLPPSNFFGRSDDDSDLDEIERDMPSILDEVCAAGVPQQQLNWHYRSRDESLIAFSNHFYYGGKLVTFPAPFTHSGALQFHLVDGVYKRGSGRTNLVEARKVVEIVCKKLRGWLAEPEGDRFTLGVITFNTQQQSLILDLLDAERREDPEVEWFFADEREEPVIVKNIENIQGDERDVMLFSITFGPDEAGKFSVNFGALNGDGGEKRLNVAVTRARREMHIVSSIRADSIDLSKTRAVGVRDFKAFLDYAERGAIALPAADEGSLGPAESPFEESVVDALEAKGWEVRTQIGVSGFRIDLGVVHPKRSGAFIAGIECDGAQYHSSATARDRDKVRQAVLEGLGWKILRIWSTSWFRNSNEVCDRVHVSLLQLLEEEEEEEESGAVVFSPDSLEPVSLGIADQNLEPEGGDPDSIEESGRPDALSLDTVPIIIAGRKGDQADAEIGVAIEGAALNPDQFYEPSYLPVLSELVCSIVENEAPIVLSRLIREVTHRHGWQRSGAKIVKQVSLCLELVECHREGDVSFCWPIGRYFKRMPYHGIGKGAIREVSRTQIATVIDEHIKQLENSEDAIRELARLLSIGRLSKDAREYLETCLSWRMDGEPE